MPYVTSHMGVNVTFTPLPDGSVDVKVEPHPLFPKVINSVTLLDKNGEVRGTIPE